MVTTYFIMSSRSTQLSTRKARNNTERAEETDDRREQPNRLTTLAQPSIAQSLARYFNNEVNKKLHSR